MTLRHGSLKVVYNKGPHPLLWADSRAACGKIAVSGIPNIRSFFIVYAQFTNMAAGWRPMPNGNEKILEI
jgi:hypothetical protein